MRSYGQFCGLARTLDVIGDRWTLLIIRELAIRPCRYTDLRNGLPGVATNLLADRLRMLEAAGLVHGQQEPPPVATTVYQLTGRGQSLMPILGDLARWGAPLLTSGQGDDDFRGRWLVLMVQALYRDVAAGALAPLSLLLDAGDGEPVLVRVTDDGVHAAAHTAQEADVRLRGDASTLTDAVMGRLGLDHLEVEGNPAAIARAGQLFGLLTA